MHTALILEAQLANLEARIAELKDEHPDALRVSGIEKNARLLDMAALASAPWPCLVDIPHALEPDVFLEGLKTWPKFVSLVVHAMPEHARLWQEAVEAIPGANEKPAPETSGNNDSHPASGQEVDSVKSAEKVQGELGAMEESDEERIHFPRLIPYIHARHKEKTFQMTTDRELSGFLFYVPVSAGLEGYEFLPPDQDEDEVLDHDERMQKYDLRRWLARYLAALGEDSQVIVLRSETAIVRGKKGCDIEMSAYCREKSGVQVIAEGGLGTVRHVLNFERYGRGAAVVMPDDIYDGSFSLHDVRSFVDSELAKVSDRGSRLSLGVLGGGRLAGNDMQGRYWQTGDEKDAQDQK